MFSKGYTSCSAGGCARIMTVSADTGGAKLASISQTWMMAPKTPREKVDDQAPHSMGCFAVQTCASGRQASIFPGPSTVRYRGLQGLLLGSSQAGGGSWWLRQATVTARPMTVCCAADPLQPA
jgi:hypothetical protein